MYQSRHTSTLSSRWQTRNLTGNPSYICRPSLSVFHTMQLSQRWYRKVVWNIQFVYNSGWGTQLAGSRFYICTQSCWWRLFLTSRSLLGTEYMVQSQRCLCMYSAGIFYHRLYFHSHIPSGTHRRSFHRTRRNGRTASPGYSGVNIDFERMASNPWCEGLLSASWPLVTEC